MDKLKFRALFEFNPAFGSTGIFFLILVGRKKEDSFLVPLHNKGPEGVFHGPNCSILFLYLETTDTAIFEANPTFGSRRISIWKFLGQICPPPL